MVLLCGVLYWVALLVGHTGLLEAGQPLTGDLNGLATAIYFSFTTATSVGYGDIVVVGPLRLLAMAEAVAALLIFGMVVSKFVSRRQDKLVREIHQVSFEERLDRVQTNLHTVFSELHAIATAADEPSSRPARLHARLESAALVFAGELRTVHQLLYRPYRTPDEPVMESLLASLSFSLRALGELLGSLPAAASHSTTLSHTVQTIARLSGEICSDCVPHAYAPALTVWMDRIHDTARTVTFH